MTGEPRGLLCVRYFQPPTTLVLFVGGLLSEIWGGNEMGRRNLKSDANTLKDVAVTGGKQLVTQPPLAFFFLRQPSRPNAPRRVAKKGSVAEQFLIATQLRYLPTISE